MSQNKMESVSIINVSSESVSFELDGLEHTLRPRESMKTHASYGLPRHLQKGRDPVASVVDMLTNGRVVHEGDRRARAVVAITQATRS